MVLAYITSEYPARSHTFIRREIEVMRDQGFKLYAFSLHRCAKSEILNEREQRVYDDTWSVFPIGFKNLLISHLKYIITSPIKYFSSLLFGFKFSGGTVTGFMYSLFYFAEAIYLVGELEKKKVRAIHVHFSNSGAKVAAIAAKYLQIPWMLSLHGSVDFEYPGILWLADMAEHADRVRCVSDYGASQVKRAICRSKYEKVFVSYCGLPPSFRQIRINDAMHKVGPIKLLAVGRLSPEKGQLLTIQAAKQLQQKGVDIVLDLVGDGPDRGILEQEVRDLGLNNIVRFQGAVEENVVLDHMRKADVFICSSFMEGLPQVLMESMAVGTPVIAPYIAGIPELVIDKKTGLLFPAGNVDILVKGIMELVDNEALYKKLVNGGRQKVLGEFIITNTILPLVAQTRLLTS